MIDQFDLAVDPSLPQPVWNRKRYAFTLLSLSRPGEVLQLVRGSLVKFRVQAEGADRRPVHLELLTPDKVGAAESLSSE